MKRIILLMIALVITCTIQSQSEEDNYRYRQAVSKFDSNDFKGAIELFNLYIENNPLNTSAYKWRGMSKMGLKDYESAFVDFTMAIKLEPTDPQSYFFRASCRNKMGKYKEANEDLDLAVRYNYIPFESVNRLRGAIHSNMKKSDSLNDELSRVLIDKINSGNIEISDNLKYYTNGKEWGKNDKALSFSSSLLILCNEKATSGDDCTESPIDFKLDFVLHYGEIESYARFSDVKRKLLWVYEITNFYKTEEGYYILATLKNSDSETILLVNTVKNVILHQTVGDPEVSIFVIDK